MALEDIPYSGAFGSHWEARLTGPEVLCCVRLCVCVCVCVCVCECECVFVGGWVGGACVRDVCVVCV